MWNADSTWCQWHRRIKALGLGKAHFCKSNVPQSSLKPIFFSLHKTSLTPRPRCPNWLRSVMIDSAVSWLTPQCHDWLLGVMIDSYVSWLTPRCHDWLQGVIDTAKSDCFFIKKSVNLFWFLNKWTKWVWILLIRG